MEDLSSFFGDDRRQLSCPIPNVKAQTTMLELYICKASSPPIHHRSHLGHSNIDTILQNPPPSCVTYKSQVFLQRAEFNEVVSIPPINGKVQVFQVMSIIEDGGNSAAIFVGYSYDVCSHNAIFDGKLYTFSKYRRNSGKPGMCSSFETFPITISGSHRKLV